MTARAITMRWRCPVDSLVARSPSGVSYPSDNRLMNSSAQATRAAAITASRPACGTA